MVPLARPDLSPAVDEAVSKVLASGRLVQGPQVERFEALLCERTGFRHAVAVSSGTAALFLAMRALGVGAETTVLCPALSWPSPAHAAALLGARVKLVDIDPYSWNGEAAAFQRAFEQTAPDREATEGVPVLALAIDQFGNPSDAVNIGAATRAPTVIDGACALGSTTPEPSPTRGRITSLSFHPRKVVTTGEGGACLTDDEALAAALRVARNHGQRRPGAFEQPGHNFRLAEVPAALGIDQLERLDEMLAARASIAHRYRAAFPKVYRTQRIRRGCSWNVQTFGLLVGARQRDGWIRRLSELGVEAGILSYALSQIDSLAGVTGAAGTAQDHDCSIAEQVAAAGLALPIFAAMGEHQVSTVIAAVERCADEFGDPEPSLPTANKEATR